MREDTHAGHPTQPNTQPVPGGGAGGPHGPGTGLCVGVGALLLVVGAGWWAPVEWCVFWVGQELMKAMPW